MAKSRTKKPAEPERPLRLEWRSPAELAENPANWRTHPEAQLAALSDVIADVGFAGACLFNERTGRLIDGHARKKVAIDRGAELVPVLVGSWTEEQERKILATLDPLAAMAEADAAKLAALLTEIDTESEAVQSLLDSLAQDNPTPLPKPGAGGDEFDATPQAGSTRTQPGDLWLIGGKHRLIVADNTVAENVDRLMDGALCGLCFTSPPYAQQRDYGEKAKEKVQDWHALMCGTFANLPMTDAGQVLVNLGLVHRDGEWVPYWDEWIEWMRSQGWRRFGWYVWDKKAALPGDWSGRLAPRHEWVFHFNRESADTIKAEPCATAGETISGPAPRGKDGKRKPMHGDGGMRNETRIRDSVCVVSKTAGGDHPAVMPVGLPEYFVESWPGDVYDPFLGSGTTLIAAHRLGRVCYGCEIECRYADVILKRAEAEGLSVERIGQHATA